MIESVGTATAFVGGLLTALTPCVYPIIPITVATFGRRTGSFRARALLGAAFVLAMAAVYSGLGALAALGGGLFGEVGSHPVVKALGGLAITALGFSLLGAFALRLPARVLETIASLR